MNQKRKKGDTGLFQKILKEAEETEEEKNNNTLEEIYKFRKELQKIGVNPVSVAPIENSLKDVTTENVSEVTEFQNDNVEQNANVINEDEISKKVQLENTAISSNTRELDVSVVNEFVKEKTQELSTTKLEQNKETQIIEPIKKEEKINETQIINVQEVKNAIQQNDENNNSVDQSTAVIETTIKEENNKELEGTPIKSTNIDNSAFEAIAGKLVEAKLNFDNTQTIDTAKVREALREEFHEPNPEFDEMYKKTFGVDPVSVRKEKEIESIENEKLNVSKDFSYASENINVFEEKEEYPEVPYKFLGIAFNTYIIIEIKNELYMIDQHAAHERIMYEKVKENYYSDEVKDQQFLLLPDVITLTHKEMLIAKENEDMFEKAGFSFEEFGDNTIKLNSVPSMCENLNTKQLFLDILDEIDTVAVTARKEKEDKFIATVACKAAVKGKMKLDEKEVHSLMKKLLELPNPFTCPHGRPTAIKMTKYDMERKFSRK